MHEGCPRGCANMALGESLRARRGGMGVSGSGISLRHDLEQTVFIFFMFI